MVGRIGHTH